MPGGVQLSRAEVQPYPLAKKLWVQMTRVGLTWTDGFLEGLKNLLEHVLGGADNIGLGIGLGPRLANSRTSDEGLGMHRNRSVGSVV